MGVIHKLFQQRKKRSGSHETTCEHWGQALKKQDGKKPENTFYEKRSVLDFPAEPVPTVPGQRIPLCFR
jgi:hypothetical protein